jgi:hypothetical protein
MSNQVNPMLARMEQTRSNNMVNNIQQMKQAINKLSSANSRNVFNSMAEKVIASNPVLKPYVQKYGMNFMQAFQEEAKNRGVDPNEILNALTK